MPAAGYALHTYPRLGPAAEAVAGARPRARAGRSGARAVRPHPARGAPRRRLRRRGLRRRADARRRRHAAHPGGAARGRRAPRPRQPPGAPVRAPRLPRVPDPRQGPAALSGHRPAGAAGRARGERRGGTARVRPARPTGRSCSCSAAASARPPSTGRPRPHGPLPIPGSRSSTSPASASSRSTPGERRRTTACWRGRRRSGPLLAAADIVVSRAGGSVFEIAAAGKPAVLVPSPNVTADHQSLNAAHFADSAAIVVEDAELTAARLDSEVRQPPRRACAAGGDVGGRPPAGPARCRRADRDDASGARAVTGFADRRLHMVGIGGAGMSALAAIAYAWGAEVDGCDTAASEYTRRLERFGIHVGPGPRPRAPGGAGWTSSSRPPCPPMPTRCSRRGFAASPSFTGRSSSPRWSPRGGRSASAAPTGRRRRRR